MSYVPGRRCRDCGDVSPWSAQCHACELLQRLEGRHEAERAGLRAQVDSRHIENERLQYFLKIFLHAYASGNGVPPQIEADARAALDDHADLEVRATVRAAGHSDRPACAAANARAELLEGVLRALLSGHYNLYKSVFGEHSNPNNDIVRDQALRALSPTPDTRDET